MKHLLEQLFGDDEDADRGIMADLSRLLEAAAKVEKLAVTKTPLAQALKKFGLDAPDLVETPDGLVLNLGTEEDYRLIVRELGTVDKLNELAELGWVALLGGESTTNASPANYQVKFIELDSHPDEPSDSVKPIDMEKVLKDAAFWVPNAHVDGKSTE